MLVVTVYYPHGFGNEAFLTDLGEEIRLAVARHMISPGEGGPGSSEVEVFFHESEQFNQSNFDFVVIAEATEYSEAENLDVYAADIRDDLTELLPDNTTLAVRVLRVKAGWASTPVS